MFAAMTVATHKSILPGVADKWTLVSVDFVTGAVQELELKPQPSIEVNYIEFF